MPPGLWIFCPSGDRVKAPMLADAVLDSLGLASSVYGFGGQDQVMFPIEGIPKRGDRQEKANIGSDGCR